MKVLLVAAAACVLVGAPLAAQAAPRDTANPRRMVLRLSDLPTGFGKVSGYYASNAVAAKESQTTTIADYVHWGRITGYENEFRKQAIVGLVDVQSQASIYKDEDGAKASLHDSYHEVDSSRKPKFLHLSMGGKLGDEARLYSTTLKRSGLNLIVYAISWRYKTVKAGVIAGGIVGTVTPESVVLLAHRQQKRIEAELG